MNNVLEIALPIFGLGLIGYVLTRFGLFPEKASEWLSRFVFDFGVPVMLVRVFANTSLPEQIPWNLLGSFYLPAYGMFAVGILIVGRFFTHVFMERVLIGFTMGFGNLVFIGLPVITLTFGEEATVPYFIILSLHTMAFIPLTTALMEFARHRGGAVMNVSGTVLKSLVTNPFIIAMVIGITLNQTSTVLPGPLDTMTRLVQEAVLPCAVFSLGASLSRYGIAGQLKPAIFLVIMKNFLFPLLVWLFASRVMQIEPLWQLVVVIMAAQPIGITAYVFAQRYQVGKELSTTAIFLSTIASMFTITLLLYWFHYTGVVVY